MSGFKQTACYRIPALCVSCLALGRARVHKTEPSASEQESVVPEPFCPVRSSKPFALVRGSAIFLLSGGNDELVFSKGHQSQKRLRTTGPGLVAGACPWARSSVKAEHCISLHLGSSERPCARLGCGMTVCWCTGACQAM